MNIIITPEQEATIVNFLNQLTAALNTNQSVTIITQQPVSPTPTASATPTLTPRATVTPTPSKTRTPTVSPSNTPSKTQPAVSPTPSSSSPAPTPTPSSTGAVPSIIEKTFDTQYPTTFQLLQGTANRNYSLISKPPKAINVLNSSYVDQTHNTKVFKMVDRMTDSTPNGTDHNRHEYSKRCPFNADNTRYFLQDGNGAWTLYDASTLTKLPRSSGGGAMPGFVGDCEPFWHPTDPGKIWHTDRNGGLQWYEYDTVNDTTKVLFDLTGKFPSSMTNVGRTWFKGEGRPSNDGRYWALYCEDVNFNFKGVIMYDRVLDKIIGWYASTSGPDHSMTSSLGNYFLLGYYDSRGVVAFPKTYQGSDINAGRKVTYGQVEHGDVGIDATGNEVYVQADYAGGSPTEGYVRVTNINTGDTFKIDLVDIYPASGEATGLHISGIISEKRPGWFIMSFHGCYSNYGSVRPAATVRYIYDRVCAVELKAAGRMLHIAEHYSSGGSYFNEPQATSNKDGTRIVFASAFNGRNGTDTSQSESYMVALPSWAIA